MNKFLLPLLLLFPGGAYAAQQQFSLDAVTLETLRAMPLSPAPAVTIPLSAEARPADKYFNAYILKAVDCLNSKYRLLGYDIHSVLTHDIPYYTYGTIPATHAPLTMCVAAQMEIILTAYQLYAQETGDYSVYDYLPAHSFQGLSITDLKGHIWVNPEFNSNGTADALINFGMGERTVFEKLKPGSFVNINRTTNTGHAVTFIGYINIKGEVQPVYNDTVVGFKYFSSQGQAQAGSGGFDYRYAVFEKFGCPDLPFKRDCNVIYSTDQKYLNTGTMLSPKFWTHIMPRPDQVPGRETIFNGAFFNGRTTDD